MIVKAYISNNSILHEGNFGINVVIDHPISDVSINDFVFTSEFGNGVSGLVFPTEIEIAYEGDSQTLFMLPVEVPDNVSGSFRVGMIDRQYTVDNSQYDNSSDTVDLPDTEQHSIECNEKVFSYNTFAI